LYCVASQAILPCDFQNAGNELCLLYISCKDYNNTMKVIKKKFSPTDFDFGKMSTKAIFMLFNAHIMEGLRLPLCVNVSDIMKFIYTPCKCITQDV
jgi:hypothetical protein